MAQQAAGGDINMDGSRSGGPKASQSKPKKTLNDFGEMGDLLSKIENKVEKQATHKQRMATGKQQKITDLDRDKERLEKIGGMQAFQDNMLDNLFLHVSNTVAAKQGPQRK